VHLPFPSVFATSVPERLKKSVYFDRKEVPDTVNLLIKLARDHPKPFKKLTKQEKEEEIMLVTSIHSLALSHCDIKRVNYIVFHNHPQSSS
jgi:hypothetical protein